jgi:hypothetical protein
MGAKLLTATSCRYEELVANTVQSTSDQDPQLSCHSVSRSIGESG